MKKKRKKKIYRTKKWRNQLKNKIYRKKKKKKK
jgi:hypothetical protein